MDSTQHKEEPQPPKPVSENKYVYMNISIDHQPVGTLLIELFSQALPRTCENFRQLCTGEAGCSPTTGLRLHYKHSNIHKIYKDYLLIGGDI